IFALHRWPSLCRPAFASCPRGCRSDRVDRAVQDQDCRCGMWFNSELPVVRSNADKSVALSMRRPMIPVGNFPPSTGVSSSMLELRNVSKRFAGIAAVDNVSFTARAGEVTGYLGPNGSGKSTTMKMITALIEMSAGQILFDGAPIHRDLIAYKRRMGYVSEEPHLYPHLSGLEYLVMVGQLRNLPKKPTAERIDGLLRLLSLHGDRHVPISSYSKGMRQKVLLSAALLHNPDLI